MYGSIRRQKMPALRNPEPGNFNSAYVLVQQQWIKAILSLEDDALVLNFEETQPDNENYGENTHNYNHINSSNTRLNYANHDGFPHSAGPGASYPFSGGNNHNPGGRGPGGGDPWVSEKRVVRIVKDAESGLGISIKGGRENRMPIVISKIFEGMAADNTQQLYVGDAILSCNSLDLSNASHDDAVGALKQAGSVVILEVQFWREPRRMINTLPEVGWELSHGFLKDAVSSPARNLRSDTKLIPLLLCYLSHLAEQSLEADATILLLQSPNLRHSCRLKFSDNTHGKSWFNMIHSNIAQLNQKLLVQCNRVLPKVLGGSHLTVIGWMAEKVYMDGIVQLKPVFAALSEKQLMVFDAVPWTKEEWATPSFTCELLTTRVLHSPSGSRNNTLSKQSKMDLTEPPITFQIRVGNRTGIEQHIFKLETCRDLSSWVKAIIQGTFRAVEVTQEMSWACGWQNHECKLCLHYEDGFALVTGHAPRREILWQQPFEKLRATADDGKRMLCLEFIDSTEPCELDLKSSPKPAVFLIHSFLAAKLHRQGLTP